MHNGILALARAERQGIRLDVKYAKKQEKKLAKEIKILTQELYDSKFYHHWEHVSKGKVNIDSDIQLATFLYGVKRLKPIKKTPSGKGSTDEEALEALGIKELDLLLDIRKLKKLKDTYLGQFLREVHEGYIHTSFNLHFVPTYRSSSDSPNMQNIPVRTERGKRIIRKCLYPRPGHQLLEIDYSGLEVCIAACYHKDPTMMEYIKKDPSAMHTDMAKQIFFIDKYIKDNSSHKQLRSGAKNGFVFPQFYGDYYGNNAVSLSKWGELPIKGTWKNKDGLILPEDISLAEHLKRNKISSLKGFKNHLREIEQSFWTERFPVYNEWREKWWRQYQKKGYLDLYTGFRCSGVMNRKEAINYPIQGAAFHCLLWSFIEADRQMADWKSKLIGQVHDSILFDVHPSELKAVLKLIKRITCVDLLKEWKWVITPLEIEAEVAPIDKSWYYKKEISI